MRDPFAPSLKPLHTRLYPPRYLAIIRLSPLVHPLPQPLKRNTYCNVGMLGAVRAGSRCGIPRAGVRAICTQAANNSRSSLTSLAAARQEKSVASAAVGGIYHHSQNRHRGFASSTRRLASSSSGETAGTARDVMSGQWSISSPKQVRAVLDQSASAC